MYNLIAAIVCVALICGTAIAITILILNRKCVKTTTLVPFIQSKEQKASEEQKTVTDSHSESPEESKEFQELEKASMDIVIKSVNELMGVTTPEKEDK